MAASYVGSLTLGGCLPLALQAQLGIDAAVGIGLPKISADIAGLLNVQLALTVAPPSLDATIQAVAQVALALQAAINGPTVTLQADAIADLLIDLNLQLGTLNAQLALSASLSASLGTAGIHMYTFSGTAAEMASAISAVIGSGPPGTSGGDVVGAVLFAASASASRAALGGFCGVSI